MRGEQIFLRGFVATPDGQRMAYAELAGPRDVIDSPQTLGSELARMLRAQGAEDILASLG
jgi:hydroxymethylbilane synthase